jgi:3-hydroxyacyl-CoA dehydrogenase
MVDNIKTVVILGASGTIGSLTGGLIAQNGIKVYFLSRTLEGARSGLRKAISEARSEVISRYVECGDYEYSLESALQEADLIIESVSEDIDVKRRIYVLVERYRQDGTVVGTTTSSLPLSALAQGRSDDFRRHFLSTHFYNPPSRMLACEVATTEDTATEVYGFMMHFLQSTLRRNVIPVKNVAGFAGNRIAFSLFNRITCMAEEYGVEMLDYLIGPYTGRLMSPLATLDLVGLDIHRAIIHNLRQNTCCSDDEFVLPEYIGEMINRKLLGNKAGCGFYKRLENNKKMFIDPKTCEYVPAVEPHVGFVEKAKQLIHLGMYREAFEVIKKAQGPESQIVKEMLARYITCAFSLVGKVTDSKNGISGIDTVMTSGFNWASPSMMVRMLGGKGVVAEFLAAMGLAVPKSLMDADEPIIDTVDFGRFFVAR